MGSLPEYDNLTFTLPTVYNYLPFEIVEVKGLTLLSHLGKDAFCIDPRRWHRVKQYISNGIVEYPEAKTDFGILDGRHRTLLLMKIYKIDKVPIVVEKCNLDVFIREAKRLHAL
ncbi:hypothetical protein FA893_02635 [Photobacterium damselae subsp. piscicida]|uniref:hypothetical protein n=1 Tax=Photobacterium damselae TaxID=38293 RepID=UPI000B962069|nr:hypothetical protein [Photobacterium damselae]TFZ44886.1 hypothetical protein E4T25_18775 [Photobacterium damselae subsp. piscicida]TJZ98866.1 hypothetical protein FA893_02635 [Photobacterium damselae subsp. piscicida]